MAIKTLVLLSVALATVYLCTPYDYRTTDLRPDISSESETIAKVMLDYFAYIKANDRPSIETLVVRLPPTELEKRCVKPQFGQNLNSTDFSTYEDRSTTPQISHDKSDYDYISVTEQFMMSRTSISMPSKDSFQVTANGKFAKVSVPISRVFDGATLNRTEDFSLYLTDNGWKVYSRRMYASWDPFPMCENQY